MDILTICTQNTQTAGLANFYFESSIQILPILIRFEYNLMREMQ